MHPSVTFSRARPRALSGSGATFVLALILLSALPLLWPDVPPLLDLPGHMGRYRVQLDLATSPDLQQFYGFHWQLIGNLGIDLLVDRAGAVVRARSRR